jgi:electron transfer flavoprotein alpha subunit
MSVLVVMEQTGGRWHRMSWETLAAAQEIAAALGATATAAVIGDNTSALAQELSARQLAKAVSIEHGLLGTYTADGFTAALAQLIEREKPTLVLFPHTYQVRDFAPKLATRLGRTLVSDVVKVRPDAGAFILVRQLFQGKLNADYRCFHPGWRLQCRVRRRWQRHH